MNSELDAATLLGSVCVCVRGWYRASKLSGLVFRVLPNEVVHRILSYICGCLVIYCCFICSRELYSKQKAKDHITFFINYVLVLMNLYEVCRLSLCV